MRISARSVRSLLIASLLAGFPVVAGCGSSSSDSSAMTECPANATSWPLVVTITNFGSGGFESVAADYSVQAMASAGGSVAGPLTGTASGTTLTFSTTVGSSTTASYGITISYNGMTLAEKTATWSAATCSYTATDDRTVGP